MVAIVIFSGSSPAKLTYPDQPRLTLGDLPTGAVTVDDITYQVSAEKVISINHQSSQPVQIATWPDGIRATQLNFLQTYQPDQGIEAWRLATGLAHRQVEQLPDWPTVFYYELVYVDGQTLKIPVRFGESIREWYRVQTIAPMLWARHHWEKPLTGNPQAKMALYAMEIPNPRPDIALVEIRALPNQDTWQVYGNALILGVIPQQQPTSGQLYFVEPKPIGNDRQIGSLDQPFGSLQKALDIAAPGDTILVRQGLYPLDEPVVKQFKGENNQWLTITAFPGETPTFDAFGISYDVREKPYGDRSYALGRFQHDTGAIHVWGDPDFTRIQGLHIQNSRRAAISVYGKRGRQESKSQQGIWGETDHVEINFNNTYQTYSMGIISHGVNDLSVIGNQVIRPHSTQMAFDAGTENPRGMLFGAQEAIDLSRNRHFEIAFNTVAGGGKEAIDCISVEEGTIHHNYVHSSLNGIYIDSWNVPIKNLQIHHNFIENAFNGIPLSTEGSGDLLDIDIHHNIILNSKSDGIPITEATYKGEKHRQAIIQNHKIYNNTIDNVGGHATAIAWQASGIRLSGYSDNPNFRNILVKNNIVTNTKGTAINNYYAETAQKQALTITHNLVFPIAPKPLWKQIRSLINNHQKTKQNNNNNQEIHNDPLFVHAGQGDFRLSKNSPAIAAGVNGTDLGALAWGEAWIPGLDFAGTVTGFYEGNTRWQPVSIAAEKFTIHRNHLQRPSWFQEGRYGADFRHLADGEQSLGGITFLIAPDTRSTAPNVMALSGIQTESSAASILNIPVNRRADKIAFLHNVHVANRDKIKETDQIIFNYRIHYTNNTYTDIPIRLGHEIEAWSNNQIKTLNNAKIAWLLPYLPNRQRPQSWLHLYAFEWQNPRPNLVIAKIDILRHMNEKLATPAVFAISTGEHLKPDHT
ncbi:MAG: right-handed parallel beta-helix repeat-containing protein [Synechocystis sp.]|nr:right-handed parallel beta-helix repeat-containing protein [Synechocystis sp.]